MAKEDKSVITKASADTIKEIRNQTSSMLYGVSQEFIDKNTADLNKIHDTIKRLSNRNSFITGDNPIEFLTKMAYNNSVNNTPTAANKLPRDKDGKIDMNKFMNGLTLGQINEIYAQELDRISTYDDYLAITRYIPQISQAINVWKDEIISPDDFTKDIFDVVYENPNNVSFAKKVERNITDIINPRYNIENRVDYWITHTLILGDQFVAILKLEDEFNKIFQEGKEFSILDESVILSEDNIEMKPSEISFFTENYINYKSSSDTSFKKENFNEETQNEYISQLKSEVAEVINNNIKFSTSPMTLLEDEIPVISQFQKEANQNKYSTLDPEKMKDALNGSGLYERKTTKNSKDAYINGSYIKTLEPDRTIKIKIGEVVYGYFYVEVRGKNELIHPKNVYSALTLRQTVDLTSSDTSMIDDPKVRLVTDLFTRNIANKIDRKFLADNKEFKTIIYELLHKDYLYNNNIQVTFFEPNTIKHLMVKEDKDGYGISVLRDVLFTAKLYLSVLITTLLTKISRSQDHRTFYIDTGLSEDVEGNINSFIRDVESKDVKMADTQSIDTIFNTIGASSNFYIPTVNGEKAVEIDTTQGLNVDMENDLLEFLRKAMISGMGVPSQMLNYSDEMEFARSVSMQNGMFLRSVITKQKKLTPPFTSMYRDLYENEFGTSLFPLINSKAMRKKTKDYQSFLKNKESDMMDKSSEKIDENNVDNDLVELDLIQVKFPSPSALNATNLAEQINSGQTIVQAIADTQFNQSGTVDENHKHQFILALSKEYMPNIDWDKVENIFESTRTAGVKEALGGKVYSPSEA